MTVKIATYQQPWRFKAGWHSGPFTFCRSQPLSHPPVLSSFFRSPSSLLLIPEAIAGISHRAVFTLLNLCEESGGRGTQTNTRRIHKAAAVVHIYMCVYPTVTQDCVRWYKKKTLKTSSQVAVVFILSSNSRNGECPKKKRKTRSRSVCF